VLLWRIAVTPRPAKKALARVLSAWPRMPRSFEPNVRWTPVCTMCMPQSSRAIEPARSSSVTGKTIVLRALLHTGRRFKLSEEPNCPLTLRGQTGAPSQSRNLSLTQDNGRYAKWPARQPVSHPARPSRRKGRKARTMGMTAAAVSAAATTPTVLLEWSAIAPYAIGANPPAPMTPV
jgi:hypothetical protein